MENLLKSIKLPEHQKEVENLTSIIGQLLLEEVGNTGLLVVENLVSNETLLSSTKLTTQSPIALGNWVSDNVIIETSGVMSQYKLLNYYLSSCIVLTILVTSFLGKNLTLFARILFKSPGITIVFPSIKAS